MRLNPVLMFVMAISPNFVPAKNCYLDSHFYMLFLGCTSFGDIFFCLNECVSAIMGCYPYVSMTWIAH